MHLDQDDTQSKINVKNTCALGIKHYVQGTDKFG